MIIKNGKLLFCSPSLHSISIPLTPPYIMESLAMKASKPTKTKKAKSGSSDQNVTWPDSRKVQNEPVCPISMEKNSNKFYNNS
jgi:hypothetical protein